MPLSHYLCEHAWLPDGIETDVLIAVENGKIVRAERVGWTEDHVPRLPGLTVPGFANAHSHAFHRALRGRTHADRGSFWTWREQMYAVADRLDPDSYHRLARAVYAEMALAGVTSVGEFHYLHHAPGGARYADPNAMGEALLAAAAEAGIRITLLDTLYLQSGVDGKPLAGPQLRFGDGSLDAWYARFDALKAGPGSLIGAALHSVRAVPAEAMTEFGELTGGLPVHAHVSEQMAEVDACRQELGLTPTELLDRHGLLDESFTSVHATHLTRGDIDLMADSYACFCPTTERDLGDGVGPARALADAGSRLTLGSDSHAVIDLMEEARALELDERLTTQIRGHFSAAELLRAATVDGHASLGWTSTGRLAAGERADLVTISLESVRTAGADPEGVLMVASAPDVTHVVADGKVIVSEGRHATIDVARDLKEAVCALF
jgi:formiminoglutamate deiminase